MAPKKEIKEEEDLGELSQLSAENLANILERVLATERGRQLLRSVGAESGSGVRDGDRFVQPPVHKSLRFSEEDARLSVENFVVALEEHLTLARVALDSSYAVKVAGQHLEGDGLRQWHTQFGVRCATFEEWQVALVNYVRPVCHEKVAHFQLERLSMNPGQSMLSFVNSFNTILRQALGSRELPMEDRFAITKFIDRCPDFMYQDLMEVDGTGPEGLRGVQQKALQLATLQEKPAVVTSVTSGSVGTVGSVSSGGTGQGHPQANRGYQKTYHSSSQEISENRGKCYVCGRRGHKAYQCRQRKGGEELGGKKASS